MANEVLGSSHKGYAGRAVTTNEVMSHAMVGNLAQLSDALMIAA